MNSESSRRNGSSSRMCGTMMFINIDLLGESAAAEQAPPQYMEMLANILAAHRGQTLYAGGFELLALFPVAILPYGHATQAVAAALDIVRRTHLFNELHTPPGESGLQVSIGLDTGSQSITNSDAASSSKEEGCDEKIARYLSELNRHTPFPAAFLSASTYQTLKMHHAWHIENLGYSFPPDDLPKLQVYAVMSPAF